MATTELTFIRLTLEIFTKTERVLSHFQTCRNILNWPQMFESLQNEPLLKEMWGSVLDG